MIETKGLTRTFGQTVAVQDLDLRVEPGEIVGFLGPNGAGKSTTVKILTCMIKPTSGSARVAGFDVEQDPMEVKRRLGYVPEAGALYETLTADEYLGMVAALRGIVGKQAHTKIGELLGLFDILPVRNKRLAEFSKGMKQKVLVSAALMSNPEVLFLDEPLNGLDANAALVMKQLLRELASQGRTILFCSHILEVVERICTRIVIINEGRTIVDGTAAEIAGRTGTSTLEAAFAELTGVRDAAEVTRDLLAALGSSGGGQDVGP